MLLLYKTVASYVALFQCLRYGGITVQMGSVDCNWAVTNTALHIVTNSIVTVAVLQYKCQTKSPVSSSIKVYSKDLGPESWFSSSTNLQV